MLSPTIPGELFQIKTQVQIFLCDYNLFIETKNNAGASSAGGSAMIGGHPRIARDADQRGGLFRHAACFRHAEIQWIQGDGRGGEIGRHST